MACPERVRKFSKALKRWLYSENGGFRHLPDGYASWVSGGCWVLARALHQWIGPESKLTSIYSTVDDAYLYGRMPQHVVLKVGDCYLDGDGASSEKELLHRWMTEEDLVEPELEDFDPEELDEVGIECPAWAVKDLAKALYRQFGDASRIF